MSTSRKIGVLVPARSADAVRKLLLADDASATTVSWTVFPITRDTTREDVTCAAMSDSNNNKNAAPLDGFLNLCTGAKDELVSVQEVVDALETVCVPFYSGAGPHSVAFNRADVAALAFYAMEDNIEGCVVPCHGTIRGRFHKNSGDASSPSMVDRLKFPVAVRPVRYLRDGSAHDTGMLVANSMEERAAAQKELYAAGHAAVFVQELAEAKPDVADVFVLCSGHWKQDVKRSAVAVRVGTAPLDAYFRDDGEKKAAVVAQIKEIVEKLFRGIYDDASLASPLRGHCLFRLQGYFAESKNKEGEPKKKWTWRVDDIEPNCCLITPEGSSSPSRAFTNIIQPQMMMDNNNNNNNNNNSQQLSAFLLSLVGFDAPPRYVEPTFRVEYDPLHQWYGVTAAINMTKGDIVFADEATSFTLVTKPFVDANWSDEMKVVFSRYAWPVSGPERVVDGGAEKKKDDHQQQHVYAIWSEEPSKWRPINHSCDPNVVFAAPHSLNCVAARDIPAGEVLTLDYTTFCDWTMKPFQCRCGTTCCRGLIEPTAEALAKYGPNAWHRALPSRA